MEIQRINTYSDSRFSQKALRQHGCFLVDGAPYEVEIVSRREAVIRGRDAAAYPALMEEFRFYAPHITEFRDEHGRRAKSYPPSRIFSLELEKIQPSQFYVDGDKVAAIVSFIDQAEDIIVPVLPCEGRYISLDGHTRLFYAVARGWNRVCAVEDTSDEWIYRFVDAARQRGVCTPKDLVLLSHEEYEEKWNRFCDDFFARVSVNAGKS